MKFILFLGVVILFSTISYGEKQELGQEVSLDQILGKWALVSIDGVPVLQADGSKNERNLGITVGPPCYERGEKNCFPYFLHLSGWDPKVPSDGRLSFGGFAGCNYFGAEARIYDGVLESKPIGSSVMLCSRFSRQEDRLRKILSSRPRVHLESNKMLMRGQNGGQLEFIRNDLKH